MKVAFLNDRIYGYASSDPSAVGGSERQQWLLGSGFGIVRMDSMCGDQAALTIRGEPDD